MDISKVADREIDDDGRAPDSGKRNYSYGEAVKCYLDGNKYKVCELVQFILLTGMLVGYTITTSISME
ncbi:hypothetical protein Pint_12877 [Pistacia integerrima]|uniref:Uncharacterized protein n=1 Tax=Pistacia integerrima TaxID=434235 RepID=A0ACC0YA82_9ROSI|nr:hypothetical protein Pint_12877 [Pistacia integerrima]